MFCFFLVLRRPCIASVDYASRVVCLGGSSFDMISSNDNERYLRNLFSNKTFTTPINISHLAHVPLQRSWNGFPDSANDICRAWLAAVFHFLTACQQKQRHTHNNGPFSTSNDSDTAIPSTSAFMVRKSCATTSVRRIGSEAIWIL